ncbi:hypothetical protein Tco_0978381 [Tanacetum coccineum]|uniref:Uncharacterized protein n=1 Tax=Tanacetum coccineum TaxID=301880 RepID=A0ABQ5EMY4_9ASTR
MRRTGRGDRTYYLSAPDMSLFSSKCKTRGKEAEKIIANPKIFPKVVPVLFLLNEFLYMRNEIDTFGA